MDDLFQIEINGGTNDHTEHFSDEEFDAVCFAMLCCRTFQISRSNFIGFSFGIARS